tara:strand:- start:5432 stop:5944 length:513 start_codon:yes stop_codon:yes gene_type:complete
MSDNTGYFNKMVAYIDGPFCHCEIQFPDETAFTVYMGTNVIKKQRHFDHSKYTCVKIPCSFQQIKTAREYADTEADMDRSFSLLMMTLAFSALSVPESQGTFCSKLCADILIAANLFTAQDTRHISPSALFRWLHREYVEKTTLPCLAIDFNAQKHLVVAKKGKEGHKVH